MYGPYDWLYNFGSDSCFFTKNAMYYQKVYQAHNKPLPSYNC